MRDSAFYAIEPNEPHAQLAAQGYPRTARRAVVRDGVDEGHGDIATIGGHLDELEYRADLEAARLEANDITTRGEQGSPREQGSPCDTATTDYVGEQCSPRDRGDLCMQASNASRTIATITVGR